MAKPSRGLPRNFSLGAKREDLDAPVDIGDFLDEDLAPSLRPQPDPTPEPQPEPEPESSQEQLEAPGPAPERVITLAPEPRPHQPSASSVAPASHESDQRPTQQTFVPEPSQVPPPPQRRGGGVAAKTRIQVNLNPEGQAALDAIMDHIRRLCPRQPDTAANEVCQSLLIGLSEALRHYDLSMVPRRGAWGSATHRSFVTALKGAAVKAIGKHYMEEHPGS